MTLPVHFNAGRGSVMSILISRRYNHHPREVRRRLSSWKPSSAEKITYTMLVPILCERLLRHERLG